MLGIVVKTERGERHVRVSAAELAGLVGRIGGAGDHFLVLQRIPDLPGVFTQVWHDAGGGYEVEHGDGGADRHFAATAEGPGAVIAALTGWAREEAGWAEGLSWSRADTTPAPAVPPLDLGEEERQELERRVREVLAAGYATRAELAECAEEFLVTGDRRPVSGPQAGALADRLWLEPVAEQSGRRGETDPERLTRAFATLREAGITAREHFACCRSCGNAEIGGAGEPDARGFVYSSHQSSESAAADGGLTLYYGGFDGSSGTTAAIGHECGRRPRGRRSADGVGRRSGAVDNRHGARLAPPAGRLRRLRAEEHHPAGGAREPYGSVAASLPACSAMRRAERPP